VVQIAKEPRLCVDKHQHRTAIKQLTRARPAEGNFPGILSVHGSSGDEPAAGLLRRSLAIIMTTTALRNCRKVWQDGKVMEKPADQRPQIRRGARQGMEGKSKESVEKGRRFTRRPSSAIVLAGNAKRARHRPRRFPGWSGWSRLYADRFNGDELLRAAAHDPRH